jgi:hypothetical protein
MLAKQCKTGYFRDFLKLNKVIGSAYRIRTNIDGFIHVNSILGKGLPPPLEKSYPFKPMRG